MKANDGGPVGPNRWTGALGSSPRRNGTSAGTPERNLALTKIDVAPEREEVMYG